MEIHIKTIIIEKMRISGSLGDYWYDSDGVLQIRVADLGDEFMEKSICVHEIIEEALTKKRGLLEPDIQAFDEYHDMRIKQGLVSPEKEAGYDENAPYRNEHTFCDSVERMMFAMANIPWSDYEEKVNSL